MENAKGRSSASLQGRSSANFNLPAGITPEMASQFMNSMQGNRYSGASSQGDTLSPLPYGSDPTAPPVPPKRTSMTARMKSVKNALPFVGAPRQGGAGPMDIGQMMNMAQGLLAGQDGGEGGFADLLNGPMIDGVMDKVTFMIELVSMIREMRLFLFWLHHMELLFSFLAFIYLYPIFISTASFNLIWLGLPHFPKAILGLILQRRIPSVESVKRPLMATVRRLAQEGPDNVEKTAENDIGQYMKRRLKGVKIMGIIYVLCLLVCIVLDVMAHLILMGLHLGDKLTTTIPAYTCILGVTTMFFVFDALIFYYLASVLFTLPDVAQAAVMKLLTGLWKRNKEKKEKESSDMSETGEPAEEDPEA